MANRWSHPHGKTSSEVVPFTWQPTAVAEQLVFDYRALTNGEALRSRSVFDETLMTVHERITSSAPPAAKPSGAAR
jgi:hypothetical protein